MKKLIIFLATVLCLDGIAQTFPDFVFSQKKVTAGFQQVIETPVGDNVVTWDGFNSITSIPRSTFALSATTLTINGTTQDLSSNRVWTVGDLLSSGSYVNPSWLAAVQWSIIFNTPTTIGGYGITDFNTLGDSRWSLLGHVHSASDITTGTIATARLGSGTANSTTFLRGDQTWQPVTGGTVTSVSVTTANGVSGSVANATTTPAISLTLGAITPTTVNGVTLSGSSSPTLAVTGTSTISGTHSGTHSGTSSGTNTGDQTSIVGITGTLAQFNTALTSADFATGGGTITGTSSGTNTGDQTLNGLLPSQTGNSGKYLTTNGTNASWGISFSEGGNGFGDAGKGALYDILGGLTGSTDGLIGVHGIADNTGLAISGTATGFATAGEFTADVGSALYGLSQAKFGVYGLSVDSIGVYGESHNSAGGWFKADDPTNTADIIYGSNNLGDVWEIENDGTERWPGASGGGAVFPAAGLRIEDSNASHVLTVEYGSNITSGRRLTLITGDADRSLTLTGDATISGTNTGDQNLSGYSLLVHTHDATDIASGTIATARLGSGTANSSSFLRGDQTWQAVAPAAATYITQTANSELSGEQALGSLATGILKNTTTTGVLSIAAAGDFPTLNQNTSGNAATVTTNANLTGPITSVGNATTVADGELAAIAGLTSAADKVPQFTGSGTAALVDLKLGTATAYGGTITWTAGAAPSGTANLTQYYTRVGNLVTWHIDLTYANAGTTVTNFTLTFPTEFPTPAIPTGFTGANVWIWDCFGTKILSTPSGTIAGANLAAIRRNAADNGFEIQHSAFTSGTYRTFLLSGTYFTQ